MLVQEQAMEVPSWQELEQAVVHVVWEHRCLWICLCLSALEVLDCDWHFAWLVGNDGVAIGPIVGPPIVEHSL